MNVRVQEGGSRWSASEDFLATRDCKVKESQGVQILRSQLTGRQQGWHRYEGQKPEGAHYQKRGGNRNYVSTRGCYALRFNQSICLLSLQNFMQALGIYKGNSLIQKPKKVYSWRKEGHEWMQEVRQGTQLLLHRELGLGQICAEQQGRQHIKQAPQ